MGLFSWQCLHCKKSILGPYATTEKNKWMNKVVYVLHGGYIVGNYDGYGRITLPDAGAEVNMGDEPALYHEACWRLAGEPKVRKGPSPSAPDQGHFIDPDDYDLEEPRGRSA